MSEPCMLGVVHLKERAHGVPVPPQRPTRGLAVAADALEHQGIRHMEARGERAGGTIVPTTIAGPHWWDTSRLDENGLNDRPVADVARNNAAAAELHVCLLHSEQPLVHTPHPCAYMTFNFILGEDGTTPRRRISVNPRDNRLDGAVALRSCIR
ncbi:hypothetical protein ASPACDRAFT_48200 [Aspergillus aculeatus ATCC 16872]|uniref:Uncharacterized protein n=1 Tax=Aspergillus aculeatus (strain ATCC 16872 / CBS 172.66 / WB 5094) TaxID=690307 RepID=A0A1L9WG63_ASPA1|nr:uncharacterized protein ASPACDRAFT_48200 [Aspergillus aculeatus ATCC 16872]OJJ95095.1 hypothetical protein ASPACDRAFT_48200 [Aspergillus aculeatus ATCC 16872]